MPSYLGARASSSRIRDHRRQGLFVITEPGAEAGPRRPRRSVYRYKGELRKCRPLSAPRLTNDRVNNRAEQETAQTFEHFHLCGQKKLDSSTIIHVSITITITITIKITIKTTITKKNNDSINLTIVHCFPKRD